MTNDRPTPSRWPIVALALMFFGPAVLAWGLVLSGWRPGGTTNQGVLLQPPVRMSTEGWRAPDGQPVSTNRFAGRWTLLLAVDDGCEVKCAAMLDAMRRVRIGLDKDRNRVQLLLVRSGDGAAAVDGFPRLAQVQAPPAAFSQLADAIDRAPGEPALFVVDYRGFRMMTYPLPLDASGLLDDMEKLLKRSNEDIERMQRLRSQDGGAA